MTTAFVLMTALPPTKGHLHLIQFAAQTASRLRVVVCTQPDEPMGNERFLAIKDAVRNLFHSDAVVLRINHQLPQDPETPGFWDLWKNLMIWAGFKPGDIVVSSEAYGQKLADINSGVFIPYDPQRELYTCRGTDARHDLRGKFDTLMPEFQHYVRQTVTVFGAESTGKTTLSKAVADSMNGHWLYEWARPYLELVGPEITEQAMIDIATGQLAAQKHTATWYDKPFVVQDTDLFSTVGYWEQPHWTEALGIVPPGLVSEAIKNKSDLYLITQSNIPFEPDKLRYGVDKRESSDEFWLGIADKYELNYRIIKYDDPVERLIEAQYYMAQHFDEMAEKLDYDRKGF